MSRNELELDQKAQLRELLIEIYDIEELRTLCFDLGIDYDTLRGEGKEAKVRELITYLSRRNRIADLLKLVSKQRPGVDWPGLEEKVSAKLVIKIQDWYTVDKADLIRGLFEIAERHDSIPEGMRVELDAPDYENLLDHIRDQSKRQDDPEVVADQLAVAAWAARYVQKTLDLSVQLVSNVSEAFSLREAIDACEYFVRLQMVRVVHRLGSYQLASERVLFRKVNRALTRSLPAIAQFVYQKTELIEVFVAQREYPKELSEYTSVYLPLERLENSGAGDLFVNIYEPAKYIPRDIWLEYVIPQAASAKVHFSLGGSDVFCPWTPDQAVYATEGKLWRGEDWVLAVEPGSHVVQKSR